jgi:hypothetical protein
VMPTLTIPFDQESAFGGGLPARQCDRTLSPASVSSKPEYSRLWPETFGEFSPPLAKSGRGDRPKARRLRAFLLLPGRISLTAGLPGWAGGYFQNRIWPRRRHCRHCRQRRQ